MNGKLRTALSAAAVLVAGLAVVPLHGRREDVSLKEVLRRAGTWVERFAEDSVFVVADERYDQEYGVRNGASWQVERRSLLSEIVWVQTPEDDARRGYPWIQLRDVIEVDGKALPDHRGRLERLFKDVSASSYSRGRALVEESARFNIGPLVREINIPSFALFFLVPRNQPRFRFRLGRVGQEGVQGRQEEPEHLVEVTYEERERPTMIRSVRHEDRPATGTMVIDVGTGRVVKTDLRVKTERHWTTDTEVSYGHDARLDIWVPTVMREHHRSNEDEYILATATYSNFRRFETSARIVPR
jgi:hypothetical protein